MDESSDEFLDWWEEHQASCEANYKGSSPTMESHGALNIWKQSVELYKLRCTSMISDGDSSTFKQLHDSKPYGASYPVTKHDMYWPCTEENGHGTQGQMQGEATEWEGQAGEHEGEGEAH